jgi:hypothetical protein
MHIGTLKGQVQNELPFSYKRMSNFFISSISQLLYVLTSTVETEYKEKDIPNAKSGSTSLASAIAASATAADPEDPPSIDIASACCSISSSS